MRKLQLVLFFALLPALGPRMMHFLPALKLNDFAVYDTASILAREHGGVDIYDGADNGIDPQTRYADPSTRFAATARQLGVPTTQLYVYPPTLSDMIIPLSFLPLRTAGLLWTTLNYIELLLILLLILQLLQIGLFSWQAFVLSISLYCAQPVVSCIAWGQVTLLLALLWLYGMWLYLKGWVRTSAVMFAIAAAIKVSPLIALFPFVIWKEWGWVRVFTATLLLLLVGMCILNGPSTLIDFAFHVMPAMSHGIASTNNQTILSAIQLVSIWIHHGNLLLATPAASRGVIAVGKLICGMILLFALRLLSRFGTRLSSNGRLRALASISMLSAPISPVTWPHGYIMAALALSLCWFDAFRINRSNRKLFFLAVCTVAVSSYLIPGTVFYLTTHAGRPIYVLALSIFTPLAIVFFSLREILQLEKEAPGGFPVASSF